MAARLSLNSSTADLARTLECCRRPKPTQATFTAHRHRICMTTRAFAGQNALETLLGARKLMVLDRYTALAASGAPFRAALGCRDRSHPVRTACSRIANYHIHNCITNQQQSQQQQGPRAHSRRAGTVSTYAMQCLTHPPPRTQHQPTPQE